MKNQNLNPEDIEQFMTREREGEDQSKEEKDKDKE